jgi:hypothetical protein
MTAIFMAAVTIAGAMRSFKQKHLSYNINMTIQEIRKHYDARPFQPF